MKALRPGKHLIVPRAGFVLVHLDKLQAEANAQGRRLLVVACVRVSRSWQHKNLAPQRAYLRRECRRRGIEIDACFRECVPGTSMEKRDGFARACDRARELQRKNADALVAVLFLDRTRVKRNSTDKRAQNQPLTSRDLEEIVRFAKGVRVATLIDPNASVSDIKKARADEALVFGGAAHGTKRERELKLPQALALMNQGRNNREIAEDLGLKYRRVAYWREKHWEGVAKTRSRLAQNDARALVLKTLGGVAGG